MTSDNLPHDVHWELINREHLAVDVENAVAALNAALEAAGRGRVTVEVTGDHMVVSEERIYRFMKMKAEMAMTMPVSFSMRS